MTGLLASTRRMLAALIVAATTVPAQERPAPTGAELDALTAQVSATLRCPVCQGESIQDSPAELAGQMRAVVRDQLAAGRSPDEVRDYFVSKYGEWVLLAPTMTGMNLLLYILPVALGVGGIALAFTLARRWSSDSAKPQQP